MAALDFAPYASLKKLLDLEKAAVTDYPQIEEIIARVKQAFESYLGYKIDLGSYTRTFFQPVPTRMVYLEALPIVSITSVEIDAVATTDYKVTNYGILLPAKVSEVTIEVVHSGGWDSSNYPDQIKEAALIQTCYEYGTVDNIGATTTTTDGGSIQRPELGLLKETKRMLDPFQSAFKVNMA
jgi:hypothetical protein